MSSKRHLRRKACDGKVRHASAQDEVGPDKHLRPTHQQAYQEWKRQKAAAPQQ